MLNINFILIFKRFPLFLSNTLFSVTLYPIDWRLQLRLCLKMFFAKMARRKFPNDLKRRTVQNPYGKILELESLFNEIAGINSRPVILVKKGSTIVVYL